MLPHDPKPLRILLRETLAVAPEAAAPLPPCDSPQTAGAQHTVVQRAVARALAAGRGGNVLAMGHRASLDGGAHTSVYPSSAVHALTQPAWELLRARIGSAAMEHLLCSTTLLTPMPNRCYQQLTGPVPDARKAARAPTHRAACGDASGVRGGRAPPAEGQGSGAVVWPPPSSLPPPAVSGTAGAGVAGGATLPPHGARKRPRLSGWRRKREKRRRGEAGMAAGGAEGDGREEAGRGGEGPDVAMPDVAMPGGPSASAESASETAAEGEVARAATGMGAKVAAGAATGTAPALHPSLPPLLREIFGDEAEVGDGAAEMAHPAAAHPAASCIHASAAAPPAPRPSAPPAAPTGDAEQRPSGRGSRGQGSRGRRRQAAVHPRRRSYFYSAEGQRLLSELLRRYRRCSFHALLRAHFHTTGGGASPSGVGASGEGGAAAAEGGVGGVAMVEGRGAAGAAELAAAGVAAGAAARSHGRRTRSERASMGSQWRARAQYGALLAQGVRAEKSGLWLRAVCRRVVPYPLIGGKRNWRFLSRNLPLLLSSPVRDGQPGIARDAKLTTLMLQGISTKECHWLHTGGGNSYTQYPNGNGNPPNRHSQPAAMRKAQDGVSGGEGEVAGGPPTPRYPPRGPAAAASERQRQSDLRLFIHWLTHRLLLPLTKRVVVSSTTTGGGPHRYFWPRRVWLRMQRMAARRVKRTLLTPITRETAALALTAPGRSLGAARLRIIPKNRDAFRAIFDLSRPAVSQRSPLVRCAATFSMGTSAGAVATHTGAPATAAAGSAAAGLLLRPVNLQLRHAFAELTACARGRPHLMGASMLSMNQVHQRWRAFASSRRSSSPSSPLHFASTDVAACYDTMRQPRTLAALEYAMSSRGTGMSHLRQTLAFRPTGHRLAMRSGFEAASGAAAGATVGAPQLAAMAGRAAGSLIVDRQSGGGASVPLLISALRQIVSSSLVVLDGRFYLQASGVPQGSVASALLCCLHYGALDLTLLANYLAAHQPHEALRGGAQQPQQAQPRGQAGGGGVPAPAACDPRCVGGGVVSDAPPAAAAMAARAPYPAAPPDPFAFSAIPAPPAPPPSALPPSSSNTLPASMAPSVLLRLIDDSLLVSTDARTRDGFLATMGRGFPEYGCATSVAKTRIASLGITKTETASPDGFHVATTENPSSGGPRFSSATPSDDLAPSPFPPSSTGASLGSLGGAGAHDPQDLRAAAPGPTARDGYSMSYFGWCGLLLNMRSCEVHPDMSRRRAHVRMSGGRLHPGCLRARMRAAVKPQLRPIFVDPRLNSTLAVRRNVHHALLHAVSAGAAAVGRATAARAPGVLAEAVRELVGFVARAVRSHQRRCLLNTQGGGGTSSGGGGSGEAQGWTLNHQGGPGAGAAQGGAPGAFEARGGISGASTLVDQAEVEWLAWSALAAVLPASLPAPRLAARRRSDGVEASGRLSGRSLQLLRAAADPRSLITPT